MRNNIVNFLLLILFSQCANQTSPNGGPQDKKVPELISSKPKNNQLNFGGEKIEVEFDEYVKLKDPAEEIMITPSIGKDTKYIAKKNKIVIIPKTKWNPNTTYSISFRDAVQDITESNSAFNLRLAFSTGSEIDSLQLVGVVSQLYKEEIPEKITVAVYQSDTFNIFNHQPTYFTKTDKKGRFVISNLKAGDYYIYAFDDKNKNLKAESKSERYGFLKKKIELSRGYDSIRIPMIRVDARDIKLTNIRHTGKITRVKFNKPIDSVQLTNYSSKKLIYTFGDTQEELIFYKENLNKDSIKIKLHVSDSTGHSFDTVTYIKSIETKVVKETFKLTAPKLNFNIETEKLTATFAFNKPITKLNLDSMYVQIDSTTFQPISIKEITIDTLHHILKIEKPIHQTPIEKNSKAENPILVLGKGAFVSIEADSSKALNNTIQIPKEEATGSLSLEIITDEKHFLLELLARDGEIVKRLSSLKKYTFKNLIPSEYKIRIIIDTNNNGIWDAGNFDKRIEPENVILYKTFEGRYTTPVRANWEVGPLVIRF